MFGALPLLQMQPYVRVSCKGLLVGFSSGTVLQAYRVAAIVQDGAGGVLLADDRASTQFIITPRPYPLVSRAAT